MSPGSYVGSNLAVLQDRVSIASANEYFLQPQEMLDDTHTTPSTPNPVKGQDVVSSSEKVEVSAFHDYSATFYSNPVADEDETSSDQLSDTKENLGSE